jgi:ABC-type Fe3+-citrate transport system substrate-binding protein
MIIFNNNKINYSINLNRRKKIKYMGVKERKLIFRVISKNKKRFWRKIEKKKRMIRAKEQILFGNTREHIFTTKNDHKYTNFESVFNYYLKYRKE